MVERVPERWRLVLPKRQGHLQGKASDRGPIVAVNGYITNPTTPLCTTTAQTPPNLFPLPTFFHVRSGKVTPAKTAASPKSPPADPSLFRGQQHSSIHNNIMAFLFRNKPKSNMELTKSTKELTIKLAGEQTPNPKVSAPYVPPTNYSQADPPM